MNFLKPILIRYFTFIRFYLKKKSKRASVNRTNSIMKIRVKSEENELEITLDINEKEHTVYDLKELIAKHNFGLSIKEQRLEFIKNPF